MTPRKDRYRFFRNRTPVRPLVWTLILLGVVWLGGLISFAATLDRTSAPEDGPRTEAIVVLTGGSERLAVGFDLLAADRADKLFISGVYRGVDVRELLRISRQVPTDLECCIVLGHDAADTEGNALETARWMQAEGFTSLRLVTANYHMPRSLVEFRRVLPGVEIVAHSVAPSNVRLDHWYLWPGTAELIVGEYTKFLLASARSILLGPRSLTHMPTAEPERPAPPMSPSPATAR